jgi:amino acid transporter
MTALDIFALIVLIVLAAAVIAIWAILGMMPGRIARERNHPQAEAINVCGWWGVITMGLLLPVAWIWAYTNPRSTQADRGVEADQS